MANIRIKDLTTTATVPDLDDFFELDGATNGGRKLSARYLAALRNALAADQGLSFAGNVGAAIYAGYTPSTTAFSVVARVCPRDFSAAQFIIGATNTGLGFYITTAGLLRAANVNTSDRTASTGALVVGQWSQVAYVRTGSTGTYYINGLPAGTTTDSADYATALAFLGAGGTSAGSPFRGEIVAPRVFNRALSDAEILAGFIASASAVGDHYGSGINTAITAGSFVTGKRYRIASAGTTNFTLIGSADSNVGTEFVATGAGTGSGTATALGLVFAPERIAPGNGSCWCDLSGFGAHVLLGARNDWILRANAPARIRATTSTNGTQQLLGGVSTEANTRLLSVHARSRSGTPTVSLGVSAGSSANIVASVALSTTWKVLTIISGAEISAGTFIWSSSNSTDVVEWDITTQPLSF